MTPTIKTFVEALASPASSLRTLRDAKIELSDSLSPIIRRSTHVAEISIRWQGKRWILSLPLNDGSIRRMEETARRLQQCRSHVLTTYRILHNEMSWQSECGHSICSSLILQLYPESIPLAKAIASQPRRILLAAIEDLRQELRSIGMAHNNLKAENMVWDGGHIVVLRYHDATFSGDTSRDDAALDELYREVMLTAPDMEEVLPPLPAKDYTPLAHITGHTWHSNIFEDLIRIEDSDLYGFVDNDNRIVIRPQYIWADDFKEDRAVVKTADGMGVINRRGEYIIEPHYKIVEYDISHSLFYVLKDELWATFDYLGRPLGSFSSPHCPEFDCKS